jgi:hypothetical protein
MNILPGSAQKTATYETPSLGLSSNVLTAQNERWSQSSLKRRNA